MDTSDINWIDAVAYGIIILSLALGAMRGLSSSLLGIAALVGAVVVAGSDISILTDAVRSIVGEQSPLAGPVSVGVAFVAAFLVFGLIARLINAGIKKIDVSGLNMIGGALFGLLRGVLFSTALVLLLSASGTQKSDMWRDSHAVMQIGGIIKVATAAEFFSPYASWVKFDKRQRPLLVGGTSSPAAAADEENVLEQQHRIEGLDELPMPENLKKALIKMEKSKADKHAQLEEVLAEFNSTNLGTPGADTDAEVTMEQLQKIRAYLDCELKENTNCELKL